MQYTGYVIAAGQNFSSVYVELDNDPPKEVDMIRITDAKGAEYYRKAHETGLDRGDSQVVKSGKTYKITGQIPLTNVGPSQAPVVGGGSVSKGTLEPFEIDATCP